MVNASKKTWKCQSCGEAAREHSIYTANEKAKRHGFVMVSR